MRIFVHVILLTFLIIPIINYTYQTFKAIYLKSKGTLYFVDSTDKSKIVSFRSLVVRNTISLIIQIFIVLLYVFVIII